MFLSSMVKFWARLKRVKCAGEIFINRQKRVNKGKYKDGSHILEDKKRSTGFIAVPQIPLCISLLHNGSCFCCHCHINFVELKWFSCASKTTRERCGDRRVYEERGSCICIETAMQHACGCSPVLIPYWGMTVVFAIIVTSMNFEWFTCVCVSGVVVSLRLWVLIFSSEN